MKKQLNHLKKVRRDNLGLLLDDFGQSQVAGRTGIDGAYLWQMGKGEGKSARGVSDENARKIEAGMGLQPGWLDVDRSDDPLTKRLRDAISEERAAMRIAALETPPSHVRFPLLEGFAGMGRGDYMGDYPEIVDFVEVTREWASQKLRGVPPDVIRVITGRGDSMRGQYSDGDLVFLDSRIKRFDADSAYCYRWNGQVQIKRLQLIGPGRVRILSKNPDYPPIDVGIEDLEIGGRAIAAWTLKEF